MGWEGRCVMRVPSRNRNALQSYRLALLENKPTFYLIETLVSTFSLNLFWRRFQVFCVLIYDKLPQANSVPAFSSWAGGAGSTSWDLHPARALHLEGHRWSEDRLWPGVVRDCLS